MSVGVSRGIAPMVAAQFLKYIHLITLYTYCLVFIVLNHLYISLDRPNQSRLHLPIFLIYDSQTDACYLERPSRWPINWFFPDNDVIYLHSTVRKFTRRWRHTPRHSIDVFDDVRVQGSYLDLLILTHAPIHNFIIFYIIVILTNSK